MKEAIQRLLKEEPVAQNKYYLDWFDPTKPYLNKDELEMVDDLKTRFKQPKTHFFKR